MKKSILLFGLFAALALSTSAFAATICTSVACVAPTDSIDWGTQGLGTPNQVWSTPQNWTTGSNSGEIGVVAPSNFTFAQQSTTWSGNFNPNEYIIWNQDVNNFTGDAGPIGVLFFTNVYAAGAQIQADFFGAFVATVCDQNGVCFSENGNSTSANDGSAIFLGLQDSAGIQFLTYSVVDVNGHNDEAIGTVYFNSVPATPEPGTLSMLGAGILGLAGLLRRKTSR